MKPEELLSEASMIGYFLMDALKPQDDEIPLGPDGKWGLTPVFKYQLALIEKAEEMIEGSRKLKAA